jgi:hypothetical protein
MVASKHGNSTPKLRQIKAVAVVLFAIFVAAGCGTTTVKALGSHPALCSATKKTEPSALVDQADRATASKQYDVARTLYNSVLARADASPDEQGCAAQGLAVIADKTAPASPSSASTAASDWDSLFSNWISPIARFATPALVVFALLLALTRLATPWVVRSRAPGPSSHYFISAILNAVYAIAVIVLGLAAVGFTLGGAWALTKANHTAVQRLLTAETWSCVAGLAVIGPLFLICGRTRPRKLSSKTALKPSLTILASTAGFLLFAYGWCLLNRNQIIPGNGKSAAEVVLVSTALAVTAGIVIGRLRGIQIGLRIQGKSKDGTDDAALGDSVRARLHSLGSEQPRGIELTQQSDVSTLPSDALALLPEGTASKAAAFLLSLFQPSAPWKVIISDQTTGGLSISLLRNSRVTKSAVIRARDLGLTLTPQQASAGSDQSGGDSTKSDGGASVTGLEAAQLHTAAAAFLLCQLSEHYAHLRGGLSGATKWRSVAAQALATDSGGSLTRAQQVELLSNAVAFDAGNVNANLALQNVRYRDGADTAETLRYAQRLQDTKDALTWKDMPAPEMRLLFNLTVAWYNYVLAVKDDNGRVVKGGKDSVVPQGDIDKALSQSWDAAEALDKLLKRPKKSLSELADEMSVAAYYGKELIFREWGPDGRPCTPRGLTAALDEEPTGPLTMTARYDRACWRLKVYQQDQLEAEELDRALDDLEMATASPSLRIWARQDESMNELTSHLEDEDAIARAKRFKELVGDEPPSELFDFACFDGFKDAFETRGIQTAAQLAARSTDWLASDLKVASGIATHWSALAKLCLFIEQNPGTNETGSSVEMTFLLQKSEISSRTELREKLATNLETFQKSLVKRAATYAIVAPGTPVLDHWKEKLR